LNTRRIAVAGLGLLLSATLSLAGCQSSRAGTSPQTEASAKDTLVNSLGALANTSYAISLTTSRLTAIGAVDPVSDTVTVTARGTHDGQPAKVEALSIEDSSWARIDLGSENQQMGINPAKWLLLDPSKLKVGSLPFDLSRPSDAFDLGDILDGIITVRRTDAQHFTGSIDLAGVRGVNSLVPAGGGLGSQARDVPFAATLDPQGRLIDLKVGGGSGHDYSFDFGISDYSSAAPVALPDDVNVMPAPRGAYSLLRIDQFVRSG
jgi:hypothetical protein